MPATDIDEPGKDVDLNISWARSLCVQLVSRYWMGGMGNLFLCIAAESENICMVRGNGPHHYYKGLFTSGVCRSSLQ